ncbi:MAG TPA: hypothetical protein DEP61_03110 [Lachnospiraceae bacterium]|nr:hypothetical protein [Lachnospiraceae bacterium]
MDRGRVVAALDAASVVVDVGEREGAHVWLCGLYEVQLAALVVVDPVVAIVFVAVGVSLQAAARHVELIDGSYMGLRYDDLLDGTAKDQRGAGKQEGLSIVKAGVAVIKAAHIVEGGKEKRHILRLGEVNKGSEKGGIICVAV